MIQYTSRSVQLLNAEGRNLLHIEEGIFPEHWTDTACQILAHKYFRKKEVPSQTVYIPMPDMPTWLCPSKPTPEATMGGESDAAQVFHRLAGTWTHWGWRLGYFAVEAEAMQFYHDLIEDLAMQRAAPNSPQWFNTGLFWAYGIRGDAAGHYWFDRPLPSAFHIVLATFMIVAGLYHYLNSREA